VSRREAHGFTLVELLVVVAIVALLATILAPSLRRTMEMTRRAVCATNERHLGSAFMGYASDSGGKLPQHPSYGGNWLWDLPCETLEALIDYGAQKEMFFCPSGYYQDGRMDKYWAYGNPNFAVTGYWWMNKRQQFRPLPLVDREYLRHINQEGGAELELGADVVISDPGTGLFYGILGGLGQACPHRTNHLEEDGLPAGGNTLFLDGHVRWRRHEDQEIRATPPDHWF
jgi:prepilin-type N-terminal cleavage/methylation domain-containing protein/prepilin-type processing-associated H-X9-DG protein